ncbi:carboxy-S-adenosyl-L-methionine synthase CmoA [Porticoccus sp. W117]|uniref:carboxy-S-adenosyl-L-methionine synthase CmoA n=1 Tax=Porticoccus sp. W117 TaxID=3054777 RepID=UPI0025970220|nr:carboxy-S-adenosyl-L-methionine synthase CmoA [Porticoccus sp. W117]MDM3872003.1 carboxy-S-adenosyl-L-methionine synthase CmoA [Porticoccus sp. W117]
MTNSKTDKVFASPLAEIAGFKFDQRVASVFPDMIKRSVPGYESIIAMIGTLAERYVQTDSRCYDLGCSLGAATLSMRQHITQPGCEIIAVDNSQAMIERCQQLIDNDHSDVPVTLQLGNIQDVAIENASMAVLNFTLQFIPVADREAMLANIANGLKPGGVLVLSEKLVFDDQTHDELMIDLHHSFKKGNGYSDLEVSQKRTALENVLLPETLQTHRQRLKKAGFSSVDVWFQCFNFASIIAIK